ncbi:hypothetical protein PBY51_000392 [Eleginops maclovinus]|uniref:G-protein coupled receptors family 3 profile domain-containing protein n=1 Tax=Eleginops maclovinus TaxID=56733 RepID=A0AAN7XMP0_ELEMC|nr:hypothetical protein PBY51_000392 [Eleginops maclovinus]
MKQFLVSLCLMGTFLHALAQCSAPDSDFRLEGDYLLGGLFDIHHDDDPVYHDRPEAAECSSKPFNLPSYQRFQLMRFSVEEINNSTNLLPNVSLGYEIFDHCSDLHNFPGILQLLSVNGLIKPWGEQHKNPSKVKAVVGPFSSTNTLTVAPLFMRNLIPLVSYGAASSALSKKVKFPSFLRTVHSNKEVINLIVNILKHFNWRWVAFLNSDDAYGIDGLELFNQRIKDTEICMAYTKGLNDDTNGIQIFQQIEAQKIHTIIVFAPKSTSEALIESAIRLNVTKKVWIAGDTWSLSKKLHKMKGIKNIGTVIGVSQPVVTIPGFSDFIYFSRNQTDCENAEKKEFCNQACTCSSLSAEQILSVDPSFNFPVYSAVHAIAHALHNALQCGSGRCNSNITVHPYIVLAELKKSNFIFLNQSIQFDENGDPRFGSYSIVFWNHSGEAEVIGQYRFHPSIEFYIYDSRIQWYTDGKVPTSVCSQECQVGFSKKQEGMHKCCFNCLICRSGTYVNITEDAYSCINCKVTEWSAAGSTSCNLRVVEYIPFTDTRAILIMVGAWALVGFTLAVSVLFAINYNTPVVRSAGGPMCFLILGCLSLCSINLPKNYNEAKAITFCLLLLILTWITFATAYVLYHGKNTHEFFQGLIQNYTKTISQ